MTAAPTPSEAERLAELIEKGPQRQGDALIATTLRHLQADNERLQGSLEAQRLISDRAIALAKELEARKPLPPARVDELLDVAGYFGASARERADFINGLRHGEGAHGIKEP